MEVNNSVYKISSTRVLPLEEGRNLTLIYRPGYCGTFVKLGYHKSTELLIHKFPFQLLVEKLLPDFKTDLKCKTFFPK